MLLKLVWLSYSLAQGGWGQRVSRHGCLQRTQDRSGSGALRPPTQDGRHPHGTNYRQAKPLMPAVEKADGLHHVDVIMRGTSNVCCSGELKFSNDLGFTTGVCNQGACNSLISIDRLWDSGWTWNRCAPGPSQAILTSSQ